MYGYRRQRTTRYKYVNKSTSEITYSAETEQDTSVNATGNVLKSAYSQTETYISTARNIETYQQVTTYDWYRIDLTFDVSGIPTNRVVSVVLRSTLTNKNASTPMGYYVSTVDSAMHYRPVTQIGRVALGYPNTPYVHDVNLAGLSSTGWYTLDIKGSREFNTSEQLTFDASAFTLIVTTDESGDVPTRYKTAKVTLAAGTYTVYFPSGAARPMAMLLEPTGSGDNVYYALDERTKITFTIAAEHDVWVSVQYADIGRIMLVKGSSTTSSYVPYGSSVNTTYITEYRADTVEGYVPTTGYNGHYEYDELNEDGTNTPGSEENPGVWTNCEKYESRNLLQTKQINTFTADGIHDEFFLTENDVTVNKVEVLTWQKCRNVNDEDVPTEDDESYYAYAWTETSDYTVTQASSTEPGGATGAKITFTNVPTAHSEGKINLRVTFTPTKYEGNAANDRRLIEKCSIVGRFGYYNNNRFFFSGNPDHRNTDYMSEIDDPTYFPADGWTNIGSDITAIQGYLHYGTELAIIKEDNGQDATVYMRSAILTDNNDIIFPVQQGAQGVGALSKWTLKTLKDEPLFLAKEGVYAVQGTNASQERTIPNRSFYIDKKLKPEASAECVAEVFKDYYIVCNPSTGHCFVCDSRYQGLPPGTNDRQRVYEWFPWDNVPARVLFATDDHLFFGTQDGRLCVFNFDWEHPKRWTDGAEFINGSTKWHKWHPYDNGYEIHAHYVTKRDHLNALDYKKTMLNDGGVIVLKPHEQSSASVTVTTDKGSWFVDQIFTDSNEPSVVIPIRRRFKNFDSIETRIENNEIREGLSILGLQYRYVITTNRR